MGITLNRASAATVSFTTPQEIVITHLDDSIMAAGTYTSTLPTLSTTDKVLLQTTARGELLSSHGAFSTAAVTSTTVATSSVTVIAANSNRRALLLYNDGGNVVYVKFGTSASTSSFTVRLPANTVYELPVPMYSGIITAIRSSGTGAVLATEVTA